MFSKTCEYGNQSCSNDCQTIIGKQACEFKGTERLIRRKPSQLKFYNCWPNKKIIDSLKEANRWIFNESRSDTRS